MNIWIIKDKIKKRIINYEKGDEVVVFRRKRNGYPRSLKDSVVYTITNIENDNIQVSIHSIDGTGWLINVKVHRSYMIHKNILRDIKINSILD